MRRAGLIVLLSAIIFLTLAPPARGEGEVTHVVQWGENLTLIANAYGTTVGEIVGANGLADPDFVWVGQRLIVSSGGSLAPSGGATHIVQAGDFLGAIASRYGVALADLVRANSIANPDLIYVGQVLVIPGAEEAQAPAPAAPTGDHLVQAGDTLTVIAARYGTTVEAIAVANGIANPSLIYVGQRLAIPGGGSTPEPTPGPTMTPLPTSTPLPGATAAPTATPTATPAPSGHDYELTGDPVGEANAGVTQVRGKIWDGEGNPVNGMRVRVWTPDGSYDEISFPSGPASGYPDGGYDMLLDSRAKDGNWLVAVCDAEGELLSAPVKVQTYADGTSVIYIDWMRTD